MPIYEFYCPDNHRIYSFLARSLRLSGKVPRCPDNPKFRMRKQVSRFVIARGGTGGDDEGAEDDDPFAGMDESKMASAMGELEREMGALDDDNADPRHMGRLMRRMSELTGKDLTGPLRDMVRRMEAGEDPDALEAEYGDVLDDPAFDFLATKAGLRDARSAPPTRDPLIYEMADYVR